MPKASGRAQDRERAPGVREVTAAGRDPRTGRYGRISTTVRDTKRLRKSIVLTIKRRRPINGPMADDDDTAPAIPIPVLLRHARGAFSHSIRNELREGDFEDLPANGPYLLGGMATQQVAASQLIRELGVSKQAASQLVDILVVRGYLTREVDPSDHRRMTLELTGRGRAAALAVRDGVEAVDAALTERLSPDELRGLRRGLVELISIKEEYEGAGHPGTSGEIDAV